MPQKMAYQLLRDSANQSMNYITRVCQSDDISDALMKWDQLVEQTFVILWNWIYLVEMRCSRL